MIGEMVILSYYCQFIKVKKYILFVFRQTLY